MRTYGIAATAVLVLGISAGVASAQPQPPGGAGGSRPGFSPYLNLLRGGASGGSATLNYYGLVRPEQQFRQQANQLQQQLGATNQQLAQTNQQLASGADAFIPVTGRGATFMNYSHYYPTLGGGGAIGGPRTGGVGGGMMRPPAGAPAGGAGGGGGGRGAAVAGGGVRR